METPNTGTPAPAGPGKILQQARIELHVTLEDVARALNLAPRQVSALENDDYSRLPGATYVRGYIRGYAQLLGLDPNKFIDQYSNRQGVAKPVNMASPAVISVENNERLVQYGALILVAVVGGLALLWWQEQQDAPPATSSPVAQIPEESPANEPPVIDGSFVRGGQPPLVATPSYPTPALVTPKTSTAATPATAPATTNTITTVTPPTPITTTTPAATPPPTAPAAAEPGVPRSRLVVYVLHESWVDIRDAQQQKLAYETVTGGRVLTLEGVAPINVFIGNADGVRIEFNGRDYDFARHRRGAVARFTLNDETR